MACLLITPPTKEQKNKVKKSPEKSVKIEKIKPDRFT
jgi:hypothetical protein